MRDAFSMRGCVLGIDGGGTQTRAVIADASGHLLGCGAGGPSNYNDVGVETARENIRAAFDAARERAGGVACEAAFLGMAGVVSPADRETIVQIARDLDLAPLDRIGVDHDIRTALASGLGGEEGIALIVGTGSSCYGRRADGRDWRAGGWGQLLDDAGSGYFLGLRAMMAATRAADGRGEATRLESAVIHALKLRDLQDIMRRVHHDGLSRTDIASLAPAVIESAAAGDVVADGILAEGAEALAEMVAAVARRLELNAPHVVLVGGVAENARGYRGRISEAIQGRMAGAKISLPQLPPVLGAVLLALEMSGVEHTPELIRNLAQS